MNNEIIFLVEESVDGGLEAKALNHSIFTEAEDLENLREMVKDAVNCHFDQENKPKIIRLHFVKEEVFSV
jgi:hypothetical protein